MATNKELKTNIFSKISDDNETMESIAEEFEETFPDYDINKLKFLKEVTEYKESYHIFSLGKKIMVLSDDHTWHHIPKILLSTQKKNNKEFGVKLLKNSTEKITYELYPFEDQRVSVNFLVPENLIEIKGEECDLPKIDSISKHEIDSATKYKWTDDLYLYVFCDEKKHYAMYYCLVENDKIISGFEDSVCYFQEGDYSTNCFVTEDKKTLVIENNGDVQSIVIIKKEK